MDLVISGGEDSLLESLSFDLPPSSSYVQQRRLVSYYPSGASTFSPSGVRVCRFTIAGDGWLDPQSLRVYAKLANTHASTALQLADGPHTLFSRVRLFIGGTLVEDLDAYGRSHQLFRRLLMPKDWVENDAIESGLQSYQEGAPGSVSPNIAEQQLAAGKYAMFNFAPLLGVMQCGKYLPIRLSGGMQLELTLGDAADGVVAGSSTSYEIQEVSLRCAVAKLDSALESSFSQMMMSNRALTLRLNTYHTQSQALPAGNSEMNVSLVRAFSRLNALFVSFAGSSAADTPAANKHQVVSFLNPSAFNVGGGGTHDEALLSWDVQLGSLKFPESPATSIPETFSLLRQATAIHDESIRTLNITPQSYSTNGYVIGVPLQNGPGAPFSGLNTRSGDLISIRAKNLATDNTVNAAGRIYVTMITEQLVEIREGSVAVLD